MMEIRKIKFGVCFISAKTYNAKIFGTNDRFNTTYKHIGKTDAIFQPK